MNNLPDEIKCVLCSKQMKKRNQGLFHRYYECSNLKCKDVTGLPLSQHKENDSNTDFGSGAYRSIINEE